VNNEDNKVFFIVNKYSGTGFKPEMDKFFHETCRTHGWELALEYTQGPGHATTLAAEAIRAGFNKIVAVGGDGTVNEVAQTLVHTSAAMGIVPKGSGNGLARHLGIPMNATDALNCLFTSRAVPIDTFRLNGKLSLNVSGIGFDGYIAELFGLEKQRGFQGYTRLVLNEFMTFREFDAEVEFDQESLSRSVFVIAIANSSQYGNNARIAPTASVRDGLLNISLLKKVPPYRLDFIYSFFSGTIDQSAYCETLRVKDAVIQLKTPMSYHIDGEPAGKSDHFTISMMPASLNMLAPCDATKF
jgi:YegS/Rv2252/BmrU family lipid kinase